MPKNKEKKDVKTLVEAVERAKRNSQPSRGHNKALVKRLMRVVKHLDQTEIHELEDRFYKNSIIPALEAFSNGKLALFCIVALGDHVTIQDWINSFDSEAELFEASARVQALSDVLRAEGMGATMEAEHFCDECEACKERNNIPRGDLN